MIAILSGIKDKLSLLLVLSIVGGLFFGYNNDMRFLKPLVAYLLFLMIYPMMITLSIEEVVKSFRDWKAIGLSLAINFIFAPAVALALGKLFFSNEPMLFTGLMLMAILPTSGMTASWTGLSGGNLKLSLVMMSVNLIAAAFLLPLYLNFFVSDVAVVDTGMVFTSVLKVVLIPLLLGDATRRLIIKKYGKSKYKGLKPALGGASSIGVVSVVFIAVALKSPAIIGQWTLALRTLVPVVMLYVMILAISHILGSKLLSVEDSLALVYSTTMRNLTIALGILMVAFGESLAVFLLALAYMVQVPLAAGYMKLIKFADERKRIKMSLEVGNV